MLARPRLFPLSAVLGFVSLVCIAAGCIGQGGGREAVLRDALIQADLALLQNRSDLVAGKYRRMAVSSYDYFRGSLPVYARDRRAGELPRDRAGLATELPLVPGLGDAHPENFGLLLASDGSLGFEPNDFDAADEYPASWDLDRLLTGLVLAARLSNAEDPSRRELSLEEAREIAETAARSYATRTLELLSGDAPRRLDAGDARPVFEDLFRRGLRDLESRRELRDLTRVEAGRRRILRGVLDPARPERVLLDLPDFAYATLDALLARYRRTLPVPPPRDYFGVLDAARSLGSGVASWPRLRVLVLVEGPTDDPADDVLLELKELADSAAPQFRLAHMRDDDVVGRVLARAHLAWARPDADPLWGGATWLGFPVQIRRESAAEKTLRVRRLEGDRGTPEALLDVARALGAILARSHARGGAAVARRMGPNLDDFAAAWAERASRQADGVERDAALFRDLLAMHGPLLGFVPQRSGGVPFDLASLLAHDPLALAP